MDGSILCSENDNMGKMYDHKKNLQKSEYSGGMSRINVIFKSLREISLHSKKKPIKSQTSHTTNERCYDSSNPLTGRAVIFQQNLISLQERRAAANKDTDDLASVLKDVGFYVRVYHNLEKKQIKKNLMDCEFSYISLQIYILIFNFSEHYYSITIFSIQ